MSEQDRRIIEAYLPIEAISKEASREKSVRKGHISTPHLRWARRPLAACRASMGRAVVAAKCCASLAKAVEQAARLRGES